MLKSSVIGRRNTIISLITLAILMCALGCPTDTNSIDLHSFEYGGIERTYVIHVPESSDASAPVPLLIALHGAMGDGQTMAYTTQFNAISDREGFIVVYPNGIDRQWNDGRNARFGRPTNADVDDVGFIAALLDRISAEFNIDNGRVYLTGISNGAMMSHRLACELTERFAAVAPVIGTVPCNVSVTYLPTAPISLLMINGTDDKLVPWNGGYVMGVEEYGRVLSVEDTVRFWVDHNECDSTPTAAWLPDADPNDGTRVWCEDYGTGLDGAEVVFYGVKDGGHNWPGGMPFQKQQLLGAGCRDINASEIIWKFFEMHQRG